MTLNWKFIITIPFLLTSSLVLANGQPSSTAAPTAQTSVKASGTNKPLPAEPLRSAPLPTPVPAPILTTTKTPVVAPAVVKADVPDSPAPVIPKPLNVMPVKIKPVQTSPDEMAKAAPISSAVTNHDSSDNQLESFVPATASKYAPDFWQNSTRGEIVAFLNAPESITQSRALREMTRKAVLTPAPHLSSESDPTQNLYALRISRLLNMGDFDSALELYKMNEENPPTPLAARAGIEAILGKGEVGVACLEQKALPANLKTESPFIWKNIDTLCSVLLGSAVGDDATTRLVNAARIYVDTVKPVAPLLPKDINALDTVSLITLAKANKFGTTLDNPATLRQLADKKIALLLTFGDNVPARELPLMAEALRRGLLPDSKGLEKLKEISANPIPSTYSPLLKEIFATGVPLLTQRVMELADTPPKQLLLLPLLTAPEATYPEGKKDILLKLLTIANQPLPAPLIKKLYAIAESPEISNKTGDELFLLALSEKNNTPLFMALKANGSAAEQQNLIYDNIFSLTEKVNYVMPSADILSNLRESANKKLEDQVVVKSLALLSGTSLEKLNPAALYVILEALNSAGLNEEKSSLVRYVLGTTLIK